MRKSLVVLLIFFASITILQAHVGSPEVVMEGKAGPYKILVSITPPDVIPGVAKVKVYLQQGAIKSIGIRSVYFGTGDEGAPAPDIMEPVQGQPGQFTGETWLMNGGSSSVQIMVDGSKGNGQVIVPVVAISTANKKLPASTGYLLAGLGIFLFVLMITIIGSSVSDAVTRGGEPIPARRKKYKMAAITLAAIFTTVIVYAGNAWWQSWATDYKKFMFRPTQATSTLIKNNGANEMWFRLDTSNISQRKTSFSYVIPDHGKMMHMFVMRIPAMDAFAHLHPVRIDSATYKTVLPGLPKGKYLVFADIVYGSGFTETIKDTFDIDTNLADSMKRLDRDDAYAYALPNNLADDPLKYTDDNTIICGKPGTGIKLKDGSTMIWEGMTNEPLQTSKIYNLKFAVLSPDNQPARLDSYLGMGGHAAIIRNDGNVYIHLHPVGTYSMAAETNFVKRLADPFGEYNYPDPKPFRDSIDNFIKQLSILSEAEKDSLLVKQMNMPEMDNNAMAGMNHSNTIEFPYSFPSAGSYRIWVQVKRNGKVLTAAFDKEVR